MPRRSSSFARVGRAYREHHEELQRILNRLSVAVTAGDGEGAARLWQVPAFVIGSETARAIDTHEEVMELYAGTREMYNARGITDTRPEILDEEWIGDKLAIVKVRWPYLDEQGREIGAEDADYTFCRDDDGQLKLRVAVMRGVEGTKDLPPS
jgi:hypothetical protein